MKKKLIYILAVLMPLILCSDFNCALAQSYTATPVTLSKEKVKIGGKIFYSHIVLEKQTLFSISKAYNTTPEEIYSANPGLKETGLKKNAVILIPVGNDDSAKTASAVKQENTTPAEPKIPAQEAPATKTVAPNKADSSNDNNIEEESRTDRKRKAKADKEGFLTHTVKWYEDLDVISEKYGVPVNIIMEINGLTGRKLKNRQKLKIPADIDKYVGYDQDQDQQQEEEKSGKKDKEKADEKRTEEKTIIPAETLKPAIQKSTVNAVLMLPLNAQDTSGGNKTSFDFYSGALLAAKEAGDNGTDVDLSVYDVSVGSLPITVDRLKKTDIVIGPVAPAALGRLLEMTPQETYVVSPLDHKAEQLATTHRNFIQAPASYATQYADLVRWMSEEKRSGDKMLVIFEKGTRKDKDISIISEKLAESGMSYETFSYSILEGRNILDSLRHKMSLQSTNHLLVASESEAFVNDVVRNINLMIHNKYKVTLYAPSRIRSFETIEVENLHNANLHVTSSYFIDYDNPQVMTFIKSYRALFNAEPSPFAFQGYDITSYFIKICSKYRENWTEYLPEESAEMLQSNFDFNRIRVGIAEIGYINTSARRIVYGPDYSIKISASPLH